MTRRRPTTLRLAGTGITVPLDSQKPRKRALKPSTAPKRQKMATDSPDSRRRPQRGVMDPLGQVYAAMLESELQQHVEAVLTARGFLWWHVPDSRLMNPGLLDIIAVHPTRLPRCVYFLELKREKGRVSKEQRAALAALNDVYGVFAMVVRPSTWPALRDELDREG